MLTALLIVGEDLDRLAVSYLARPYGSFLKSPEGSHSD